METQVIENISNLYQNYKNLYLIRFDNLKLAALSSDISKLFSNLGDQRDLAFWPKLISTLKRFRFELATTPLPLSSPDVLSDTLRSSLNSAIESSVQFPESIDNLKSIHDLINNLSSEDHPFMKWINSKYKDKNSLKLIAICLPNTRNVYVVEQFLKQNKYLATVNYEIINPRQLKNLTFYDHIIFCGSIHLFSENQYTNYEYVWRSPRAKELYFLSFSWVKDEFSPAPTFDINPNVLALNISNERITDASIQEEQTDDLFKASPIPFEDLNFSPLTNLDNNLHKPFTGDYSGISNCECRIVFLDDGSFLYKENDSYSHIVNFETEADVVKIKNRNLEQGMPLIVRTEGSDDSIAAVADMLFGKRAESIRQMQTDWKISFRRMLFSYEHLFDVQNELIRLGSGIANETNIRNWSKNETIKPNDFRDFKAIMDFSGIPEKSEEYWQNAKLIFQMHIRAGREISKLLRSRITRSSIRDLAKYGRIEVDLPNITGKLSVIHIEAISDKTYIISVNLINKLHYN